VSETVDLHAQAHETPLTPESWGKLGMWNFLVGDAMSFGTRTGQIPQRFWASISQVS
jgi:heme/copper-type cytochrome/quinol oxidase subunit 3